MITSARLIKKEKEKVENGNYCRTLQWQELIRKGLILYLR